MRKTFRKVLSLILCTCMILGCMSLFASAQDSYNKKAIPTVFLDGINSSDTVNTKTGETVFPPNANMIISAMGKGNLLHLVNGLAQGDLKSTGKPVSNLVKAIFAGVKCDKDGNPDPDTTSNYVKDTPEMINLKLSDKWTEKTYHDFVRFSFDWRLDLKTLADQFHDWIEYVLECTGAKKVNVIAFSMGTCIMSTYMKQFDDEYLNKVVFLSGGFNGVSTCSEPFSGDVEFTDEGLTAFLQTLPALNSGLSIVTALTNALHEIGIMEDAARFATKLVDAIYEDAYSDCLPEVFGTVPGFWSLISYDKYDDAKKALLKVGENCSQEFIDKIDYYHYEIQGHLFDIIDDAKERGIDVSIVAKYGLSIPPVCPSQSNIGDIVIDTKYESLGATCAPLGYTLGDNYTQAVNDGHNHIAADNIIDASTCRYPDNTWFLKGRQHSDVGPEECAFYWWLIKHDNPTVFDDPDHPQFMIHVDNNTRLVPLTAENNINYVKQPVEKTKVSFLDKLRSFYDKILDMIAKVIVQIKKMFK